MLPILKWHLWLLQYEKSNEAAKEVEKVATENQKTIEDVSAFLNVQSNNVSNHYFLK